MEQKRQQHCIWLSRHVPTPAQRRSLAGYVIHQINPPGRFFSAVDALVMVENAARAAGGMDVIVVVMPYGMQKHFLELVNGRAPVLRAVFNRRCDPPQFMGWKELVAFQVIERDWLPGGTPDSTNAF